MKLGAILVPACIVLASAGAGFGVKAVSLSHHSRDRVTYALIGDDFGRLRREALELFPRGSPVGAAQDGLRALRFKCSPVRHLVANINAPAVQCDSAGRGYPTTDRVLVTVMARNAVVSDIMVGNGLDGGQADARTPDPQPRAVTPSAESEPAKAECHEHAC